MCVCVCVVLVHSVITIQQHISLINLASNDQVITLKEAPMSPAADGLCQSHVPSVIQGDESHSPGK